MDSTKLRGYAEAQSTTQKGANMSPEAIIAESIRDAEQQCPKCGSNNTESSNLNIAGGDKLYLFCKDCHKHYEITHGSNKQPVSDKPPAQVGGSHYNQAIEPIEYIEANSIPFHEANVIKYISRWRKKNGIEDLRKSIWYIERLIELEGQ